MFEPELYKEAYKNLKSIDGQIIGEHFRKVKWSPEGCSTFMDIGSGSGDVLMDYIYPHVADKFNKFICSDVSKEMVEFLKKNNQISNSFEPRLLDITTPTGMPNDLRGKVDHLTANNVVHMVQDVRSCVKNIYALLRPDGGECLLIFSAHNTVFRAYDCLIRSPKWLRYKQEIKQCLTPLYYSANPEEDFIKLLKETGFTDISVDRKSELCKFDTLENYRVSLKSSCVILKYLPTPSLRSEFMDDFVETTLNIITDTEKCEHMNSKYLMRYEIVAVKAKRT